MPFNNRSILIISPEPWGECFVSKHHYAAALAKQENEVFFLNPPGGAKQIVVNKNDEFNVNIVDYPGHFPGLRFLSNYVAKLLDKMVKERIEKACRVKFDVVWSFDNSRFFNLNVFDESVAKICHIVDYNQDFQTGRHATTADICLTTSRYISAKLKKYNDKVFNIGHGYNQPGLLSENNITLPGSNKIKALYVGNLAIPYIDWFTIKRVIDHHSQVDFIFIGPRGNSNLSEGRPVHVNALSEYSNVFFLESKPSHLIPFYLAKGDVLLMIYKSDNFRKQLANPHKMIEYLGSGKPVICSYTEEYKDVDHELIIMAQTNSTIPELFKKVVANLTFLSSHHLARNRKQIALNNSYSIKINQIEKIISEIKQNSTD